MLKQQKGASQIDFALALSVMIVVIAFSIFYVTSYFSRTSPIDKTSELFSSSSGIGKILFDSSGVPANWENNNYAPVRAGLRDAIPRIAIITEEKAGVNHSFEEIDLHIVFDKNCGNTAYNNSIRVYDQFMNDTAFRIYNQTECAANSGFLREANINFLTNITGNASRIFWLYHTNNTATPQKSAYNFYYDSSLVGYWKLDSVNASNYTQDSTANHNDGKLYNGSTGCFNLAGCINLTAGQINGGLNFDGIDDYADAGNGASLNINGDNPITYEAWINMPNSQSSPGWEGNMVVGFNSNDGNYYGVWPTALLISTNKVYLDIRNSSGLGGCLSTTSLSLNAWHHIVGVYQGGGNAKVYIDGILDVACGTTKIPDTRTHKLLIGRGYNFYFNGTIDEVRIYNRSLSADEIKALYNYTLPKYISSSNSVPAITHKKISALQNLSYADAKDSLDLKKNFNITACEYSFGRHIPDTANVIASNYPIILLNSTGSVKPCLANVNVW